MTLFKKQKRETTNETSNWMQLKVKLCELHYFVTPESRSSVTADSRPSRREIIMCLYLANGRQSLRSV